ncbi:MAG: hypothetical protein RQ748_10450, partial [Elusimicrobiales bacterium]|nr:hypothetical protein [Elusimicrobiales bacterium]
SGRCVPESFRYAFNPIWFDRIAPGGGNREESRPNSRGRVEDSPYFPEDGRGMWNGQGGRSRGRGRDERTPRQAAPAREESPRRKPRWFDFFRKEKR